MKPCVALLTCVLLSWLPVSAEEISATEAFHSLLDDHWSQQEREKIYFRTDPDAWRPNGKLSEHTPEARSRRRAFNEDVLARLADIDADQLDSADRLSYRIFRYERETERAAHGQPWHFFPINSLFGYHSYFADAPANMSFLNAADYDDYLVSLADFPRYNSEFIANLRDAVKAGYTHYCGSMQDYDETISVHVVANPTDSALYLPFESFPATVNDKQRAEYAAAGIREIRESVVPAYEELLTFFNTEYMPNCRKSPGITSLPDGDSFYQHLISYFTTTDMSPQEIHELGLSEVKRIRAEMEMVIESVGFDGDFREFLDYLRQEPRFYAKSIPELLGSAALIAKTAEGELPKYFSLLPRGTYNIKANPNRGTFYMPSSGDGTTSGTYFVGAESLDAQPLYTLEALTLHEGVPGHHLQSGLAMELDVPKFRRTMYHSAYGEGWGLYSERFGKEMGFYADPYSDFGRLTYEIWRAGRLVVDTGMHALGWSRQQAVDYMLANAALSELEVSNEIDRYITWPAQATSYKIGELKIRELRARAEAALGEKFDIRSFHDLVIGNGSLPIAVLETLVDDWIADSLK